MSKRSNEFKNIDICSMEEYHRIIEGYLPRGRNG